MDEDFDGLAESLSDIPDIAPSEEELRAYLGDAQYEKIQAYNDAKAHLELLNQAQISKYWESRANLYNSSAILATVTAGAIALLAVRQVFR